MSLTQKKIITTPVSHQIMLWINAFRPKTLTAAVVPILVATAYSYLKNKNIDLKIGLFALISSIFIQIGTNLVNDAADFKTGADNQDRIGPMRVTSSGHFTYKQVMMAAGLSFLLAIIFGAPLVVVGGLPIVVIGIFSILCAYAYTAGPFPLAYKGLGDFFVILFFGLVAVGGMNYLYLKEFHVDSVVLGLQIGFLSAVLIAINNLRDVETDKLVNKNTMAVRLGKKNARIEILILVFSPFLINLYWWQLHYKLVVVPFIILPLAVKIIRNIFKHEPSPQYNQFLGQAAGLHMLFGLLLSAGFLIIS